MEEWVINRLGPGFLIICHYRGDYIYKLSEASDLNSVGVLEESNEKASYKEGILEVIDIFKTMRSSSPTNRLGTMKISSPTTMISFLMTTTFSPMRKRKKISPMRKKTGTFLPTLRKLRARNRPLIPRTSALISPQEATPPPFAVLRPQSGGNQCRRRIS